MLEILLISMGIGFGILLSIITLILLFVFNRKFAKGCIYYLVAIIREIVDDVLSYYL